MKRLPKRTRNNARRHAWAIAACVLLTGAASAWGIVVVEPGHSLILVADSVAPLDPSQVILGTNGGPAGTGIESITVDELTGKVYVQVMDLLGACPSATTAIYEIDPALGGLTVAINAATAFGICERGSDIDITDDPVTGARIIVAQDMNLNQIATVTIPGGALGVWVIPSVFAGNTFGMQFAPGIGPVPAGDIVYVADLGSGINSAPFAGPNALFAVPPGGGDDLYIQPDGDIIFVGDFAVGIHNYVGGLPLPPVPAALPPVNTIFLGAGLPFVSGTRATACPDGQGFITYSSLLGGTGVFRIDEPLTTATLVLTTAVDEGIHDITVGPSTSGVAGALSLFLTLENFTTTAHQVWEVTNICKQVEPKWTQLPHGDLQGFNVASDVDWQTLAKQPPGLPGPGPNWVVADDFQSDGRPITCVRWWGSYLDPAFEPAIPAGANAATTPVSGVRPADGPQIGERGGPPAVAAADARNGGAPLGRGLPRQVVCVPPGDDCWSTPCGSSFATFSNDPIPAGFFDPGSLPFDGVIDLGGGPGLIDTQVQRLGQMCFPDPLPATDTVAIELIQLDLVSCQPITVQGSGDWDVQVGLAGPQPPGQMTVTKTHPNGGVFTSDFFVQPIYIFSRVGNPADIRILDTLQLGIPPILMQTITNACWSTDESLEQCTIDGFAAGVCGGGCCKPVCHSSGGSPPLHQHCATPPLWPPCPQDVDGWLVSFHTDLPIGPLGFSEPLDLLGLYFCPKSVISIQPTQIFGWDGHRVFDYFVELQDCHLVHSLLDPRPGANPPDPAQPDAFLETQNFIYWLDIQAVVGHTYTHGKADLFGSEPIGGGVGGTSQIWDITVPGGPDALIGPPVHPIAALSGLANCGGSIIGVTGNAGGGTIHTFTFGGVLTSSRASGLAVVTSLAGASTAPPASAALGFTVGNVYATAGTGALPPLTDSLVDLGPCGAGPDVLVGPLVDALGAPVAGIDGLAFDQATGTLYGSTNFAAFGAPFLVTIGAGGLVTPVGPILIGGVAPAGTVAGLAFSEGTLYGSLGSGVGDIIAIPPAAPGASVFDHAVTGGLGSIAGLTFQQAWVEVQTTNWAKDHFWGWHTSPDLFNDESVMGMLAMSGGEWLYQNWQVVDGLPHNLPRVDQAFELLTPIVPPSCPCLGDVDGSGFLNGLDIQGFVDCMLGVAAPGINCACADMNGDGVIDLLDVPLFVTAVLTKSPCP